jgi:hypothetical protein
LISRLSGCTLEEFEQEPRETDMSTDGVRTGSTSSYTVTPESVEQAEKDFNVLPEPAQGEVSAADSQPVGQNTDGSYDLSKLSTFSQQDGIADTMGDQERCSCNSTTAALVAGGKDKLLTGVQGARQAIQDRIDSASNPAEAQVALGPQLAKLDQVEKDINDGKLTTKDLNEFSSVLYQNFSTTKGSGEMQAGDVLSMQKAVGLVDKDASLDDAESKVSDKNYTVVGQYYSDQKPGFDKNKLRSAQQGAADNAFAKLDKGDTATVRVFNGPPDQIGKPNHYVTIGKDKNGQPYVYDPMGKPDYISGQAAKSYLASKAGMNLNDPYTADGANYQQQDVDIRIPLTKLKK